MPAMAPPLSCVLEEEEDNASDEAEGRGGEEVEMGTLEELEVRDFEVECEVEVRLAVFDVESVELRDMVEEELIAEAVEDGASAARERIGVSPRAPSKLQASRIERMYQC